jgi:hypothetical protein
MNWHLIETVYINYSINYLIKWARPIDRIITLVASPLIAIIIGLRSWIISNKIQKI